MTLIADKAPFYIVGTERSGSNLLRVMLNTHPNLDVPHPPHIFKYFSPIVNNYGDLSASKNRARLVADICSLITVHIYPWDLDIDQNRVIEESSENNLCGIMGAIYDQHKEWVGKSRWGCKSTFMVDHATEALELHAGSKFIWLVRDPRDVAASSKKSVFSPFHPFITARLWSQQQKTAMGLETKLGTKTVLRVRYEDLLSDTEHVIRGVCMFLGEDFDHKMLAHQNSTAAKMGSVLSESWKNTGKALITNNHGKYSSELSRREIELVELECACLMSELGYTADTSNVSVPSLLELAFIKVSNFTNFVKVEFRSIFKDRNHWRRWGRSVLMWWLS